MRNRCGEITAAGARQPVLTNGGIVHRLVGYNRQRPRNEYVTTNAGYGKTRWCRIFPRESVRSGTIRKQLQVSGLVVVGGKCGR